MNRIIASLLLAGLAAASVPAMAGDASSDQTASGNQWMQKCMAKMKQANNGMSQQDMEKSCRDQMKAHGDQPTQKTDPVVPGH